MGMFPERKKSPFYTFMEGDIEQKNPGVSYKRSILLELCASDDLNGFKHEVEEKGCDIDEASFWYGRRIGSKQMGYQERTPLMIAAMYGSIKVLKYIVDTGLVDLNRACDSDGVTALHCAIAGGSESTVEIIQALIDASADVKCADANGRKASDLITYGLKRSYGSRAKKLEMLLKGVKNVSEDDEEEEEVYEQTMTPRATKEYPVDITLPDINDGLYSTDEFRMYSFKVKPCSRAYSHDWTGCPFVHPGENAKRRDPRKYPYSCVPCPEFRKGACRQGDACEYAHGVFESWLHPAQYRTRLCKDEIGCTRKVCFFAHKREEMRPVYASTGSGMPSSPKSLSASPPDMAMSPMALGSSPPSMSPKGGNLWQNKVNHLTPPTLQLSGSRLKTAFSARDIDLDMKILGLENHLRQQKQQQQLIDEMYSNSSPSFAANDYSNFEDVYGSPNGVHTPRGNMNQVRASYPSSNNVSSSPVRALSSFGLDSPAAVATAVMNSRSSSFAKRSQSFIDRGVATPQHGFANSNNFSNWNSLDGKLDWGIQGEELNKLRKSSSFGVRSNNANTTGGSMAVNMNEPDVSWVNTLVRDVPVTESDRFNQNQGHYRQSNGARESVESDRFDQNQGHYRHSSGVQDVLPPWLEQLYREQEQTVV